MTELLQLEDARPLHRGAKQYMAGCKLHADRLALRFINGLECDGRRQRAQHLAVGQGNTHLAGAVVGGETGLDPAFQAIVSKCFSLSVRQ